VFLAGLGGLPASTVLGCLIGALVGREPLGGLWFLSTHRLFGGRLFRASSGKGPKLRRGVIAGVPAAALIAAGRPEEAREAIARAREEYPEPARIADVERLLEPRPAEL
jgi:hypothetical protein